MEQVRGYKILGRLKSSRTGAVYLVLDLETGREFVLRMIQLDWFAEAGDLTLARERLKGDLERAGRLEHPSVVKIRRVFDEFGFTWVVTDRVQGETLERLISQELPPARETILNVLDQVAECLDHAHREGVVHQHLKPSKIVVQEDSTAQILGFGLGRVSAIHGVKPKGEPFAAAHCVSREQAAGQPADARSDQFSLGMIAYQILAGQAPFSGPEMLYNILQREPTPPEILNPALNAEVGAALLRALAKNPDERYESCSEFVLTLTTALEKVPGWTVLRQSIQPAAETLVAARLNGLQSAQTEPARVLAEAKREEPVARKPVRVAKRFPIPASVIWMISLILLAVPYAAYEAHVERDPAPVQRRTVSIATSAPLGMTVAGKTYIKALQASGGSPPYTWSLSQGELPPGLSLDADRGIIGGMPMEPGIFQFTVRVTDARNSASTRVYSIPVSSGGRYISQPRAPSGPAEPIDFLSTGPAGSNVGWTVGPPDP